LDLPIPFGEVKTMLHFFHFHSIADLNNASQGYFLFQVIEAACELGFRYFFFWRYLNLGCSGSFCLVSAFHSSHWKFSKCSLENIQTVSYPADGPRSILLTFSIF
jgi:hypothetical protein